MPLAALGHGTRERAYYFMLIPQFTLRRLIVVTAAIAVLSLIVTWGGHGTPWAIGVIAMLVLLGVTVAIHVLLFAVVWLVSLSGRQPAPRPVMVSPPSVAPEPPK